MATPVTLVENGGLPVTNTEYLGAPFTPVDEGGIAVTLVDEGGLPVTLVNEDGSLWVPAFASGALSFNGNAVDLETVTIGETVYRYVDALAQAYDVLIGGTASITINNHIAAINAGAGEGTVYGTGTVEHPDVEASTTPGQMDVTAKVAGTGGNSIATTSTAVNATWGAATLQGGG